MFIFSGEKAVPALNSQEFLAQIGSVFHIDCHFESMIAKKLNKEAVQSALCVLESVSGRDTEIMLFQPLH